MTLSDTEKHTQLENCRKNFADFLESLPKDLNTLVHWDDKSRLRSTFNTLTSAAENALKMELTPDEAAKNQERKAAEEKKEQERNELQNYKLTSCSNLTQKHENAQNALNEFQKLPHYQLTGLKDQLSKEYEKYFDQTKNADNKNEVNRIYGQFLETIHYYITFATDKSEALKLFYTKKLDVEELLNQSPHLKDHSQLLLDDLNELEENLLNSTTKVELSTATTDALNRLKHIKEEIEFITAKAQRREELKNYISNILVFLKEHPNQANIKEDLNNFAPLEKAKNIDELNTAFEVLHTQISKKTADYIREQCIQKLEECKNSLEQGDFQKLQNDLVILIKAIVDLGNLELITHRKLSRNIESYVEKLQNYKDKLSSILKNNSDTLKNVHRTIDQIQNDHTLSPQHIVEMTKGQLQVVEEAQKKVDIYFTNEAPGLKIYLNTVHDFLVQNTPKSPNPPPTGQGLQPQFPLPPPEAQQKKEQNFFSKSLSRLWNRTQPKPASTSDSTFFGWLYRKIKSLFAI